MRIIWIHNENLAREGVIVDILRDHHEVQPVRYWVPSIKSQVIIQLKRLQTREKKIKYV